MLVGLEDGKLIVVGAGQPSEVRIGAGWASIGGGGGDGPGPLLPILLPLGAQQPVRAEAVAVLQAHLPGVVGGDRVQPWRGALTAATPHSAGSSPRASALGGKAQESAGTRRRRLSGGGRGSARLRGWAGPHPRPAQGLVGV